ncbi:MAG: chemotaxis protein CheA [Pseudomonadota bacterium]|nr:chemotaxis protein CheA [Pseudomonadota bacterium]
MTIDISQFHESFLAEASEHLNDFESGLLEIENSGEADLDAIFRAAHSIKGGAGTFGFDEIAEFTHVVESVLQNARDGLLELSESVITELLRSIDVLAELIDAAKESRTAQSQIKDDVYQALSNYLGGGSALAQGQLTPQKAKEKGYQFYEIEFEPFATMAQTGNDAINIIKELQEVASLNVQCSYDNVPPLYDICEDEMYLSFHIEAETSASVDVLQEAFMFVEDEAKINIKALACVDEEPATGESGTTAEKTVQKPKPHKKVAAKSVQKSETSFIRVAVDKVDTLINMVGELVTNNAMLELQIKRVLEVEESQDVLASIDQMNSHTRNLQESIMAIRMMPLEFAFSRFPRMVRDTAQKLGKKIDFQTNDGQTELDRTVIDKISDPLNHLIRNAVDHGIESAEQRLACGKPEEGKIELVAFYRGGNVVIDIIDDGKGLDPEAIYAKAVEKGLVDAGVQLPDSEIFKFIFHNGFSTAQAVTDVSGRGVGMDVVAKNIKALNGSIEIFSEKGKGTKFSVSLPLTLAIVDGMATKVGQQTYIIPLLNIIESIKPTADKVKTLNDNVEVMFVRGEYIPILRLKEAFVTESGDQGIEKLEDGIAIIVEVESVKVALFVDELIGQLQVVIKNLEDNYKEVEGLSGASILGDGSVALILDLQGLVDMAQRDNKYLLHLPQKFNSIESEAQHEHNSIN